MIKTICYGHEDVWGTREEAIKHFIVCAQASEGSERERYTNILLSLLDGQDVCADS